MTRRLHLELLPDWLARGDAHGLHVLSRTWHVDHLTPAETGNLGFEDEAFAPPGTALPRPGLPRRADTMTRGTPST